MNVCYIGLGSNQKCPDRQIRLAIEAIKKMPLTSILKVSSLYWSKAWGLHTQQDFCNVIIRISTTLTPYSLLTHCQTIEKKQGRVRKKHWGPRVIDIDIILYAQRIIKTKNLTIPHPYMLSRDFVLKPLLEINPQIQLPGVNTLAP